MIPIPEPDADTAFFWEATRQHRLDILRCGACGTYVHYPKPVCWRCGSRDLAPATVSGRGTIYSFTVTHQDVPGYTAPFTVVLVELSEQPGLRMVSTLVEGHAEIGAPVEVTFRDAGEVTLPVFRRPPGA